MYYLMQNKREGAHTQFPKNFLPMAYYDPPELSLDFNPSQIFLAKILIRALLFVSTEKVFD